MLPQTPSSVVAAEFDKPDGYPEYAAKLGNLTLLEKSINASVGNGLFKGKQPAYRQSSFLLTKSLGGKVKVGVNTAVDRAVSPLEVFESWNADDIDRRQRMLARMASKVWDVPLLLDGREPPPPAES